MAESLNVVRMVYIGMRALGYPEREAFQMTPRKFFLLYNEYLEMSGLKKREMTIDDL